MKIVSIDEKKSQKIRNSPSLKKINLEKPQEWGPPNSIFKVKNQNFSNQPVSAKY